MAPARGHDFTPVQVQKLFFLLDMNVARELNGPHFSFEPYHYGPFDANVYRALDQLSAQGFAVVGDDQQFQMRTYRLTAEGQDRGDVLSLRWSPRPPTTSVAPAISFGRRRSRSWSPRSTRRTRRCEHGASSASVSDTARRDSVHRRVGDRRRLRVDVRRRRHDDDQPSGAQDRDHQERGDRRRNWTSGLGQRFEAAVDTLHAGKEWKGSAIEKAKAMSSKGIGDFAQTGAPQGAFGALVGFVHQGKPELCEFAITDFQPEMKGERCWYVSMGSAKPR